MFNQRKTRSPLHLLGIQVLLVLAATLYSARVALSDDSLRDLESLPIPTVQSTGDPGSKIASELLVLRSAAISAWHHYDWVIVSVLFVAATKLFLAGESLREIVACGIEVVAFLLMHTIEIVRFASLGLRKLAKELRTYERTRKLNSTSVECSAKKCEND